MLVTHFHVSPHISMLVTHLNLSPYSDIFSDNSGRVSVIAKLLQKRFTAFTTRVNRTNPCSASDNVNVIDNDINVSDDLE